MGVVVAAGILLIAFSQGKKRSVESGSRPGNQAGQSTDRGAQPSKARTGRRPAGTGGTRWDRVKGPLGPETLADLMAAGEERPLDNSTMTGMLEAARRAMAARDLPAARRHTDAALAMAQSPTERTEAERVGKLLDSVDVFWRAAREELAGLTAGQEIQIGTSRVIVVDNRDGTLTLRASGQNRRFSPQDMPWQLAVALAQRRLPGGQAGKDLRIGSFLAVDALGDQAEARRRLERAGDEGAALMAELESAAVSSGENGAGRPVPGTNTPVPRQ
jgi:hypothetical protein